MRTTTHFKPPPPARSNAPAASSELTPGLQLFRQGWEVFGENATQRAVPFMTTAGTFNLNVWLTNEEASRLLAIYDTLSGDEKRAILQSFTHGFDQALLLNTLSYHRPLTDSEVLNLAVSFGVL